MALDFPTSPTNGQVYGNYYYDSSKGAWRANQTPIAETTVSPTAPVGASAGDLWYNTSDGNTYVRYNDGSSTQWVQISSLNGFSSTIGPTVDALNAYNNTNYILNSDFSINQRSASSTVSGGGFVFDRWRLGSPDATTTYSAQTFTAGSAPVSGYEAANYARLVTAGQSGAGVYSIFIQPIEDVRTLAGQTATVSFWARAGSGTPKVTVEFEQIFGTGGSPSAGVTTYVGQVTLTTSWTRYSVTGVVPSISGKTIGTTANSSYLGLNIWVSGGTTWNSRHNSMGIQTNTFDFWGVQVQSGSLATQYHRAHPSIQAELAACQRYYQIVAGPSLDFNMPFVRESVTQGVFTFIMPVPMRANPTLMFGATAATGGSTVLGRIVMRDTAWNVTAPNAVFNVLYAPNTTFATIGCTHASTAGSYVFAEFDTLNVGSTVALQAEL